MDLKICYIEFDCTVQENNYAGIGSLNYKRSEVLWELNNFFQLNIKYL